MVSDECFIIDVRKWTIQIEAVKAVKVGNLIKAEAANQAVNIARLQRRLEYPRAGQGGARCHGGGVAPFSGGWQHADG